MNKHQISGKFDQAAGKLKQKAGEATGNQDLANRGVADQVKGAAKETWGNVKETAHEVHKTVTTKENAANDAARHNVTNAAQHEKERISDQLDDVNRDQEREREHVR